MGTELSAEYKMVCDDVKSAKVVSTILSLVCPMLIVVQCESKKHPRRFFSISSLSQGSVATCYRCGGIFNDRFIANLPLNVAVKKC